MTNDLKFSSLVLKNYKTAEFLWPDHPFTGSEKTLIKTAKHFSFNNLNYHCHDDACMLQKTGSCCHFLKFLAGNQHKYGLLLGIHFDIAESDAVVSVCEFESKQIDFSQKVTNECIRKTLEKLNSQTPLGYIVQLTQKLDLVYLSIDQLINPCVTYKQNEKKFCFSICKVIEHNWFCRLTENKYPCIRL